MRWGWLFLIKPQPRLSLRVFVLWLTSERRRRWAAPLVIAMSVSDRDHKPSGAIDEGVHWSTLARAGARSGRGGGRTRARAALTRRRRAAAARRARARPRRACRRRHRAARRRTGCLPRVVVRGMALRTILTRRRCDWRTTVVALHRYTPVQKRPSYDCDPHSTTQSRI